MADEIIAARVRELFHYDPDAGIFTWRIKPAIRVAVGDRAGALNAHGYRYIKFDGLQFKANRLAWLYVYGCWPSSFVDHINGDRSDDRITNLRDVSNQVNIQNERKARSSSASGIIGVTKHVRKGKWRADIGINGKNMYLGLFDTAEEARQAYLAAKRKYHEGCTI